MAEAEVAPPRLALSGRTLAAAGFLPVWGMLAVLLLVSAVLVPDTLSRTSLTAIMPIATFLAVASLGQMLVVMTAGIDLSIPGVVTMAGTVMLGVSQSQDSRLLVAVGAILAAAVVVGAINGFLVVYFGFNPLVTTIATGQIVIGLTVAYRSGLASETSVPPALASIAAHRIAGCTLLVWVGVLLTLVLAAVLSRTVLGRRFQAVGANPAAARIVGMDVRRYTMGAYVVAAVLYATAGMMLAAFIRTPTLDIGSSYLLGPIAAVVIAGASLSGGRASATSTWAAAIALTLLTQMLLIAGLPSSLQFVVFGAAIAAGMVVSGERIVVLAGRSSARRTSEDVAS